MFYCKLFQISRGIYLTQKYYICIILFVYLFVEDTIAPFRGMICSYCYLLIIDLKHNGNNNNIYIYICLVFDGRFALKSGPLHEALSPSVAYNVPASYLPSAKPAPRPAKVEDKQLRNFLQKDTITSFDAFKRDLQKQCKNLIISKSEERFVCLFMTENFRESSLSIACRKQTHFVLPNDLHRVQEGH